MPITLAAKKASTRDLPRHFAPLSQWAKKESAEDALKYAEDFINGPLANEEAKTRFDELAEMGLASLGGLD